jgi:hypothetical protein
VRPRSPAGWLALLLLVAPAVRSFAGAAAGPPAPPPEQADGDWWVGVGMPDEFIERLGGRPAGALVRQPDLPPVRAAAVADDEATARRLALEASRARGGAPVTIVNRRTNQVEVVEAQVQDSR